MILLQQTFQVTMGFLNMLMKLSIATQRRYRWMKDLAVIVSKKLITDKNKLTVNDKTMHATQNIQQRHPFHVCVTLNILLLSDTKYNLFMKNIS